METFKFFQVKSKGITRQLSSYPAALKLFNKINRDGIKNEDTFHTKLFGKENLSDSWTLIDELKVTAEYYES